MRNLRTALRASLALLGVLCLFLLIMGLATLILINQGWLPPDMAGSCPSPSGFFKPVQPIT